MSPAIACSWPPPLPRIAGKLLEYVGRVAYVASDGTLRVSVEAHHQSLRHGTRQPTCEFHFVFRAPESGIPEQVQPDSYEEGLLWLEGRRRWLITATERGPSE